jgi:diaminopimelate epimerase
MTLSFYKYQGTGNDFVIIDNRAHSFPTENRNELVAFLCNRRIGIGADGLILLENTDKTAFKMVYFNSDGNESTMCGNGGRCIVAFAKFLNLFQTTEVTFEAIDGLHYAEITDIIVKLQMKDVDAIENLEDGFFLNTGSPHVVKWVYDAKNYPVFQEGREIRNSSPFSKEGTNVNFVSKNADGTLFVRTYERGVEDETYSCGTGVTAVAIVASEHGYKSPVTINTLGGDLKIYFTLKNKTYTSVYLEGSAKQVFKGEIEI